MKMQSHYILACIAFFFLCSCVNIVDEFERIDEAQKKISSQKVEEISKLAELKEFELHRIRIEQCFQFIDSIKSNYLDLVKEHSIQHDNDTFPSKYFFESKRSMAIKNELLALNSYVQDNYEGDIPKESKLRIDVGDFHQADGTLVSWEEMNFKGVPSIAVQSILSKHLADIRSLEYEWIQIAFADELKGIEKTKLEN